jgi:hypothetical protein
MKMIKYPSIGLYHAIVKGISEFSSFKGLDDDGNPMYDYSLPKPIITFVGTPKGHGTNASVCYDYSTDEMWIQSRERIISITSDNAGFAFFVNKKNEYFKNLFHHIKETNNLTTETIVVYGEWAGPNIQSGVAISQLSKKTFFVFDIKVVDDNENVRWIDPVSVVSEDDDVYLMYNIKHWTMDIDFNKPHEFQNKLIEMTNDVEQECPIGKYFGISGIGEGIVWRGEYKGSVHRFKVKGSKHSSSKVSKTASVDVEKVNSINEFVEYSVTENRLMQGIEQVFTQYNKQPSIEQTGAFIKWISNDVIKEEIETLIEAGLEPKAVSGSVAKKAADWFKNFLYKM